MDAPHREPHWHESRGAACMGFIYAFCLGLGLGLEELGCFAPIAPSVVGPLTASRAERLMTLTMYLPYPPKIMHFG